MSVEITIAGEGSVEVAVGPRLVAAAGLRLARAPIDCGGKATLDDKLKSYVHAAKLGPWLVLRDLDHDEPCAGALVTRLTPDRPSSFLLRASRATGPDFYRRISDFASRDWDPARARSNSPSLERCMRALERVARGG